MGKRIRITEQMISDGDMIVLPKTTVAVSITNMYNSTNDLLIGWNEDASSKNYLTQGDSRGYGPYNDGQYIGDQILRFKFQSIAAGTTLLGINQGLLIISIEDGNC